MNEVDCLKLKDCLIVLLDLKLKLKNKDNDRRQLDSSRRLEVLISKEASEETQLRFSCGLLSSNALIQDEKLVIEETE